MIENKKILLPILDINDKIFSLNQNKEKDRIMHLVGKHIIFELCDSKNHVIEVMVGKLLNHKNDILKIRKYDDGKLETKQMWTDIDDKDLFKDFEEKINICNIRGIEEYLEYNKGVKIKEEFVNNICEITNRENKKITVLIRSFDDFEIIFYYKYKKGEIEVLAEGSCPIYLIDNITLK